MRAGAGKRFRRSELLAINLPNGIVTLEPDETLEMANGTVVLRRVRTGHRRSDEYDRFDYTLYHLAGQAHYGRAYAVEALHLTDGHHDTLPVPTTTKMTNGRTKSDGILTKIGAGHFPPKTNDVTCPRCPHFFVCDAVGRGPLDLR